MEEDLLHQRKLHQREFVSSRGAGVMMARVKGPVADGISVGAMSHMIMAFLCTPLLEKVFVMHESGRKMLRHYLSADNRFRLSVTISAPPSMPQAQVCSVHHQLLQTHFRGKCYTH